MVLLKKLELTPGAGKGRPGVLEVVDPGGDGRLLEGDTGGLTLTGGGLFLLEERDPRASYLSADCV